MGALFVIYFWGIAIYLIYKFVTEYLINNDNNDNNDGQSYVVDKQMDVTLSLMTSVMCCNGSPTVNQLDIIKAFIRSQYAYQSEQYQKKVLKRVQGYMRRRYKIDIATNILYRRTRPKERLEFMHLLLKIAYADGGYDEQEKMELWHIAKGLKMDFLFNGRYTAFSNTTTTTYGNQQRSQSYGNNGGNNHYNTRGSYSGYQGGTNQSGSSSAYKQTANWDYQLLGLTPTATNDQVKKAYRKLAMQYHPDRLTGKSEAEKKIASKKFEEITGAYDSICNQRGMK